MMMSSKPRVGVAGAGGWGRNIVRTCSEAGVLAAVCDENPLTLARLEAEDPGLATTGDYGELLELPIDAVVLATPAREHAAMAIRAIESGKHVFVEKPFALSRDDAVSVIERSDARGVIAFAGHLLLYHPAIEEVLRRVHDGSIGDVRHIRSRRLGFGRLRDFENVWWSFAPHDVAIMLALTQALPASCASHAVTVTGSDLADFCYADYAFDGGITAHIEVGWLDPIRSHRLDVIGTRGTITFQDAPDGAGLTLNLREIATNGQMGRDARSSGPLHVPFPQVEPLRAEIDAFVRSIQTGTPARSGGRSPIDVTGALAMADACALPGLRVFA